MFRFFGLTLAKKEDLFLDECIDISIYMQGNSFWDAYRLPVPYRKYIIKRFNKHQENKEKGQTASVDVPLTQAEKMRFIQKAQTAKNRSVSKDVQTPKNMFQPVRNK